MGLLFLVVASIVALLVGIVLTSQAAQAQGLLDGAQGAVQETAGAPAAPEPEQQAAPVQEAAPVRQPEPATLDSTQQTTAPISAPASEPVASEPVAAKPVQDQGPAPIQPQAAPAQERAIEPVVGAAGQTTGTAPGTVQETVAPAAEPVSEPAGQTTGAAIDTVAQTAEPVTAPVEQTAAPMVGTVQQSAEPMVDTVVETPHLAQETVGPVTQPVLETANETTEAGDSVVQPVADTFEGTTQPVKDTVEPVVGTVQETTEPVLKPVADTVEPVVKPVRQAVEPVRETVDPVIDPGEETPEPVIDPVRDPDNPAGAPGVPGAKPAQETIDPLDQGGPGLKPNERPNPGVATTHRPDELPNRGPQPTGAATIEAPAGQAQQATEPVLEPTSDSVLRIEGSAGNAAVLEEGAVRAGEGISLDASSRSLAGTSVILQDVRGASTRGVMLSEQATVTTVASGSEGSLPPSFSLGVSIGEHSSTVDYFTTTTRGAQGVLPRPSPLSGATPTGAAGSSSSGLGASSGGLGFGTLVAMLLTLSALRGRLLLFSHIFLKPNSAPVLAIERPG